MKTLAQYIVEIFDKPLPFKYHGAKKFFNYPSDDHLYKHKYSFDAPHGTGKYRVELVGGHKEGNYNVMFRHHASATAREGKMGITGQMGSHSHKVLSTVHAIVKQHIKNDPNVKSINFSADEPSRAKLYDRVAKASKKPYTADTTNRTDFNIKVHEELIVEKRTITKSEAKYKGSSHSREKCVGCSMFRPKAIRKDRPKDTCTLVEGTIEPQGYCQYWEKKYQG